MHNGTTGKVESAGVREYDKQQGWQQDDGVRGANDNHAPEPPFPP
jgi:hypothetical protein